MRQRKGHGLEEDRVRSGDTRQPKKQEASEHEFPAQQLANGLTQEREELDILTAIIILEGRRVAEIPKRKDDQRHANERPLDSCAPVAEAQPIRMDFLSHSFPLLLVLFRLSRWTLVQNFKFTRNCLLRGLFAGSLLGG